MTDGGAWTVIASIARAAGLAGLVSLNLLVAACGTLPSTAPSAGAPLAPRHAAESFTASGRVAARIVSDSTRGFSGGFSWAHAVAADTIELLTPLGQLAARMHLTSSGADVELADGKKTFAPDAEAYLSEALGLPLPLSALPSWLQAVPVAGASFRAETDAVGRPTTLWQSGWEVQYTEYADASPLALPTRIRLSQGDVEARMIIAEWKAP